MYVDDKDSMGSMKSALKSKRMKAMKPEQEAEGMQKESEVSDAGQEKSDLAPLPDHSQQLGMNGDNPNEPTHAGEGANAPVIDVKKDPGMTTVSVQIPTGGEPDMDDLSDEMTHGMADHEKESLMGRAPKSLGEAARKAALMSRSKKM